MTTFRNLNVYIKSKELVKQIYELLKKFPKEEQFALSDQLRRAVISVPSNLAEGSGRYSVKEQLHFIEISYGSLLEVECQLDIAHDIKYISDDEYLSAENQIGKVASLLSGLRSKRLSPNPQSLSSSNPLIL
jgi:four helix bundle protein